MEEKCIAIKVSSFEDLVRFASSMRMFGQNSYILHFERDNRHIYGVIVVFRDYYKYYGLPLFNYIEKAKPLQHPYIS